MFRAVPQDRAPVIVLKEGTRRIYGKDVLMNNILVAKVVAETMKTSLGPKGMDKMLVDRLNNIVVTNDGATIMRLAQFKHPVAKMLVEIAKSQDIEVGDGTTTVVVLAGYLLINAADLIKKGIHPVTIAEGYRKSLKKALEVIDSSSMSIKISDRETIIKAVKTSLSAKYVSQYSDHLANLAIDAVANIAEYSDDGWKVDLDNIKITVKAGGSIDESRLVRGIVLDKEVAHPDMPRKVENAKIALLDSPLDVKKPELSARVYLETAEQYKQFLLEKENIVKEMIEKISNCGVNVIFCRMNIDEKVQHYLARKSIMAVKRVKKSDLEKISKATGAYILSTIDELSKDDLGKAKIVEERRMRAEDKMLFIDGCENPKALSILLRGSTEEIVREAERCLIDGLSIIRDLYVDNRLVCGGGSIEMEISLGLREYAASLKGKEQLAVQAFADAIEVIPAQLASSCGMDPIVAITTLRAKHNEGQSTIGINVIDGQYEDMYSIGVLEPAIVKKHVLKAATEAAVTILKIDDIVVASSVAEKEEDTEGTEKE